MRRFLFLALAVTCVTCKGQKKMPVFPDVQDVLRTLLSKYAVTNDTTFVLKLEKRITGWHVKEQPYAPGEKPATTHLFWDASSGSYLLLPYARQIATADVIPSLVEALMEKTNMDESTVYSFRCNIYYGYDGWDWDQIEALKDRKELSNTLTEALARAYSSYASAYLFDQWGFSFVNNDPDRVPLEDNVTIPLLRINKFITYQQKAIQQYDALQKRWPKYTTLVGPISFKKANEHMFAFTSLAFAGYQEQANQFIRGLSYPDSLLTMARKILDSVKPNSILITSGDNASYPLWFLQYQGIRRDVAIIDNSLLSLPRAIHYFNRQQQYELFDIDSSVYQNPAFSYVLFNAPAGEELQLPLDSFLAKICRNITTPVELTDGSRRSYYSTHKVFQPVRNTMAADLYGNVPMYDQIETPIAKDYMLLGGLMQLSICNKNFLHRRIYFTFGPEEDIPTEGIKRRGSVWELTPEK